MHRYWKVILSTAVLAFGGAGAVYVWPTPYRGIVIQTANPRILAAREQRFTHRLQLLTRAGWVGVSSLPVTPRDTAWDPLAGYTPNWRK